jgi:spore coat protein U-like protein
MRTLLLSVFVVSAAGTISPQARAAMSCGMSFTDLDFGSFNPLTGSEVDSTSTGTLTCSGASSNTTYRFCSNQRQGPDYDGTSRNMPSGSNLLPFALYTNASHTQGWGNWTQPYLGGGLQFDVTSDGSGNISKTVTMYGAIPSGQQATVPGYYQEYMAPIDSSTLQYGSKPSNGSCPVGSSTTQYQYNVDATATTNCTVSVSTLNFGSASLLTSNADATSTVTVQCTNTTPYSIGVGNGTNVSGSQRRLRLGSTTSYLNYGLYTDSGRTAAWTTTTSATSCTSGSSTCYLGTGTGSNQSVTIYGRVPTQIAPALGTYTDTVIVTLTY